MTEGLDHRSRDKDGTIHRKRGDTLIGTLRSTYGKTFGLGHRARTSLASLLGLEKLPSLSQYLKHR